jgi:hypothetical protein
MLTTALRESELTLQRILLQPQQRLLREDPFDIQIRVEFLCTPTAMDIRVQTEYPEAAILASGNSDKPILKALGRGVDVLQ